MKESKNLLKGSASSPMYSGKMRRRLAITCLAVFASVNTSSVVVSMYTAKHNMTNEIQNINKKTLASQEGQSKEKKQEELKQMREKVLGANVVDEAVDTDSMSYMDDTSALERGIRVPQKPTGRRTDEKGDIQSKSQKAKAADSNFDKEARKNQKYAELKELQKMVLGERDSSEDVAMEEMGIIDDLSQIKNAVRIPQKPTPRNSDNKEIAQTKSQTSQKAKAAKAPEASASYTLAQLKAKTYPDMMYAIAGTSWENISDLFQNTAESKVFYNDTERFKYIMSDLATRGASFTANDDKGIPTIVEVIRSGFYLGYYNPSDFPEVWTNSMAELCMPAMRNILNNPACNYGTETQNGVIDALGALIGNSTCDTNIANQCTRLLKDFRVNYKTYLTDLSKANAVFKVMSGVGYVYYTESYSHYGEDPKTLPSFGKIDGFIDELIAISDLKGLSADDQWLADNGLYYMGQLGKFYSNQSKILDILTQRMDQAKKYSAEFFAAASQINESYNGKNSRGEDIKYAQLQKEGNEYWMPKHYTFDDGAIEIQAGDKVSPEKIKRMYWATKEVESQFFRVNGIDKALEPNNKDKVLTIRLFNSPAEYKMNSYLNGISTDNGGMYIEPYGTFYTYERTKEESVYSLEELFRHEFTHYLQGKYQVPGMWGEGDFYKNNELEWFDEGTAEFFAGSTRTEGVQPRQAIIGYLSSDPAKRFTLDKLFKSGYASGWDFYNYGWACISYLYNNDISKLHEVNDAIVKNNINSFRTILKGLASDSKVESEYQKYMQTMVDKPNVGTPLVSDAYTATHSKRTLSQIKADISSVTGISELTEGVTNSKEFGTFKLEGKYSGASTGNKTSDWAEMNKKTNEMLKTLSSKGWTGYETVTCYFTDYKVVNGKCEYKIVFRGLLNDGSASTGGSVDGGSTDGGSTEGGSSTGTESKPSVLTKEIEPNDSFEQASKNGFIGNEIELSATCSSNSDRDHFAFEVESNGKVDIKVTGGSDKITWVVYKEGDLNSYACWSQYTEGNATSGSFDATPGKYFIRIYPIASNISNQEYKILISGIKSYSSTDSGSGSGTDTNLQSYTLGQLSKMSNADMMKAIAGTKWNKISDLFKNTAESRAFFNDTARFKYIISDLAKRGSEFTATDDKGIPTIVEVLRSGFYLGYYNPNEFPELMKESMTSLCIPAMEAILNNKNMSIEKTPAVLEAMGALIGNTTVTPKVMEMVVDKVLAPFRAKSVDYLGDLDKSNAVYKLISSIGYVINTELYNNTGKPESSYPSYGKIDKYINEMCNIAELKIQYSDDQWYVDNGISYAAGYAFLHSNSDGIKSRLTTLMDSAEKYGPTYMSLAYEMAYNMGGKNSRGEEIDFDKIAKEADLHWLPNEYVFDDGAIVVHAGDKVSAEKIQRMYWATKEVESQFFRVNGNDKALEPNNTDKVLTIKLYNSPKEYKMNWYINFISTDNGGMYVEPSGTFYTYERTPEESVYSLEELFRHEFTHFLQGRYQVPGLWGQGDFYSKNDIEWFDEGTAEFFAGSTRTEGVKPRKAIVGYIDKDPSKRFTIDKLIKSGYASGWDFYNYGWAYISYLYNNDIETLAKINDSIMSSKIDDFRNILNNQAKNSTTESGYQAFMEKMKNDSTLTTPLVSDAYTAKHEKRTIAQIKEDISSVTGIKNLTQSVTNSKGNGLGTFKLEGKYSGTSTGNKTSDWKQMNNKANEMLKALSSKGWTGYETVTCYFTDYKVVDGKFEYNLVFRGLLNDGSTSSTGGSNTDTNLQSYTLGQLSKMSNEDMMKAIAGTKWSKISDLFKNTAESRAFFNDTARFKYIISDLAKRGSEFTETDDKGIPTIVEVLRSGFYLGYYNPNEFPELMKESMTSLCIPAMEAILNNKNMSIEKTPAVLEAMGALIGNTTVTPKVMEMVVDKVLVPFRAKSVDYLGKLDKSNAVYKLISSIGYVINTELYNNTGKPATSHPSYGKIDKYVDEMCAIAETKIQYSDDQWYVDNGISYAAGYAFLHSNSDGIKSRLTTLMDSAEKYGPTYMSIAYEIAYNMGGKNSRGEEIDFDKIAREADEHWLPNEYIFDDGAIVVHAGDKVSAEKIQRMYWATKEVESQFFRVNGNDKALEPNNTDKVLTIKLYNSPKEYKMNWYINFISTDNGGMYVEPSGTFYTYERTTEESVYSLEELFRHEFTHFLQGRYQVPGLWGQGDFYSKNDIEWFDEATAEFFAGSTRTEGVKPRKSIVGYIDKDPSKRFTIDKLIKSGYASGWDFYNYGWAYISYLYNNDIETLAKINDSIMGSKIEDFRNILNSQAKNSTTESGYQAFMEKMKNDSTLTIPLVSDAYTKTHSKRTLAQIKQDISSVTGISTLTSSVTNSKGIGLGTFKVEGKYSGTSTGNKTSDWKQMNNKANEMLKSLSNMGWTGYETVTCYFTDYKVVNGQFQYNLVFKGLLNDGSASTGGSDSGNVTKPTVMTKEVEPNDSMEDANKNGFIGNNVELSAVCSNSGDGDYFAFEVEKNGKVDIKVTGGADKLTWVVYKESQTNSYACWSQYTQGNTTSGEFDGTPGKYFIKIYPTSSSVSNQEYKVLINGIKSYSNSDSGSEIVPPTEGSQNNAISNGKDVSGTLVPGAEEAIYLFEVNQSGNVDIKVNSASNQFTWIVYKESDPNNLVCWSQYSDAQGTSGSFNATSGKYCIKLYSLNTQEVKYTVNIKGIK